MSDSLRVTRLVIHPLKGARGISVPSLELDAVGPVGDRRWMLVAPDGTFLSQRSTPAMALIRVALDRPGGMLRFSHPAAPDSSVELPAVPEEDDGAARRPVEIWGDRVEAIVPDPSADRWFSGVLERPCRVVHLPADAVRRTDPDYPPRGRVAFADGFPLLLVSEESLAGLNARLETPLGMERFRPNIVVAGAPEPHAEDRWKRFHIGQVPMAGVKTCARCAVTTVDPETGRRGVEPLRTLADYRQRDGKVHFGLNVVHGVPGRIRRGDPVRVDRARPLQKPSVEP